MYVRARTSMRAVLVVNVTALLLCARGPTFAGTPAGDRCKDAKARAAGEKAAGLLRAAGRNIKKPDTVRLAHDVSRAQSRLTRAFARAEGKGGCLSVADVSAIEAKVDALVTDVLGSAPAADCGNGVVDGVEECDDGGNDDGDGCSAACLLEDASALCAGMPAVAGTSLDAVRIASGLSSPVDLTAPPLDPGRLFVVEQDGRIRIIRNGTLLGMPFLAIESKVNSSGNEQGLLGLAFHPDYETNGRFFIHYTNNDGDSVIARYEVSADPDEADDGSEVILLTVSQPFANHNSGQVAFGPDGLLYVGMGDGGSGGDPFEAGQDDATLLGKMLRLDVDVEVAPFYAVPPSNPNAGAGDPRGLIWAKGLRNPWRFSFDRANGDLYIADVGQGAREEIDYQPAASPGGENYGWNIFEGNLCFDPQPDFADCPADPPAAGLTMPVLDYTHGEGCSVTGGFVYRGCAMPDLHGTYFYADFCSAFIRTFTMVAGAAQDQTDRTADLAPDGGLSIDSITSFGEDARGELYILDRGGEVYRFVPGS